MKLLYSLLITVLLTTTAQAKSVSEFNQTCEIKDNHCGYNFLLGAAEQIIYQRKLQGLTCRPKAGLDTRTIELWSTKTSDSLKFRSDLWLKKQGMPVLLTDSFRNDDINYVLEGLLTQGIKIWKKRCEG